MKHAQQEAERDQKGTIQAMGAVKGRVRRRSDGDGSG